MPLQPDGMTYFEDIIQSVGNTPLVRLNKLARGLPATVRHVGVRIAAVHTHDVRVLDLARRQRRVHV